MASTGMILKGVWTAELTDSSGEVLELKGLDVSDVEKGHALVSYEHVPSDEKDKTGFGQEIVGKVLKVHKVFNEDDCEDDYEKKVWKDLKSPFMVGWARLYDQAGHPGAQSIAAAIRDDVANGEAPTMRWSVEGSTIARHDNRLKETVFRRITITTKPCLKVCSTEIVSDPGAPKGYEKNPGGKQEETNLLADLVNKADLFSDPVLAPLGGTIDFTSTVLVKEEDYQTSAFRLLAKAKLLKALTAGIASAAPSSLVGGSALQREDRQLKAKSLAALRDYGKRPFNKGEFKEFLKAYLPKVDQSYIDHFADVADDFHVKRSQLQKKDIHSLLYKAQALVIDLHKSLDDYKKQHQEIAFNNRLVIPGKARHAKGEYALLDESPTHYIAIPSDRLGQHTPEDLVKLPKSLENSHYEVIQRPAEPLV